MHQEHAPQYDVTGRRTTQIDSPDEEDDDNSIYVILSQVPDQKFRQFDRRALQLHARAARRTMK